LYSSRIAYTVGGVILSVTVPSRMSVVRSSFALLTSTVMEPEAFSCCCLCVVLAVALIPLVDVALLYYRTRYLHRNRCRCDLRSQKIKSSVWGNYVTVGGKSSVKVPRWGKLLSFPGTLNDRWGTLLLSMPAHSRYNFYQYLLEN
jgi:hypothetical protein